MRCPKCGYGSQPGLRHEIERDDLGVIRFVTLPCDYPGCNGGEINCCDGLTAANDPPHPGEVDAEGGEGEDSPSR